MLIGKLLYVVGMEPRHSSGFILLSRVAGKIGCQLCLHVAERKTRCERTSHFVGAAAIAGNVYAVKRKIVLYDCRLITESAGVIVICGKHHLNSLCILAPSDLDSMKRPPLERRTPLETYQSRRDKLHERL